MSRNISEIASNRAGVRPGEKYGIEVEAEGCPHELVPEMRWSTAYRAYWSTVADGSLRNGGVEFLSKPLGRTAVRHAINALWPYFGERRMVPSVRTGIHIHCSFLGLNTDHVIRVLRHYALVEPVLFDYVGAEREENIYCIPWYRSPSEAETAYKWIKGWVPMSGIMSGDEPCKYSAMFVGPLSTFGTIEFRHAPTWTDSETMYRWWLLTQALFRTHETEYDVLDRFSELGPVGFAKSIFPFDWLAEPAEKLFEDADVETVCSLLDEPRIITSTDWGRAPELLGPGVAAVPTLQRREAPRYRVQMDEDEGRFEPMAIPPPATTAERRRRLEQAEVNRLILNARTALDAAPALTVNAAEDEDDEYLIDSDYDDDEEEA